MNIHVSDYSGKYAITQDDGQQVYELILAALREQGDVELDFEGVDVFASPFFNAAVGQLVQHFDDQTLNANLKVRNLSPDGRILLRQVVKNAQQYYSDDLFRTRLENILAAETGTI